MLSGNYKTLYETLVKFIDKNRLYFDPLYTLAFGSDASFYRLIPKLVVKVKDETEVSLILSECSKLSISVTFRAAGTSLSGQTITDSVLIIAGNEWKNYKIENSGDKIHLQPGITGGKVNLLLSKYGRKIGPDPASINAAMIGGIAANNASGMCCGIADNSYKTVAGMKIIFADGTQLNTANHESKLNFLKSHSEFIDEIEDIAYQAKNNKTLSALIEKKYKIKNTTGYSLNALVDFTDPFEIIEHLMIGSEGTLGFISEISYKTVIEHKYKASSLIIFDDIEIACKAVVILKNEPVSAVELIDRAGLKSVENKEGIPVYLKNLEDKCCALLVETRASQPDELNFQIKEIIDSLSEILLKNEIKFTSVKSEFEALWRIRKGLFPSVGAMRKNGTTVIIEDVAFPLENLAEATLELQELLKKWDYNEAVIFGHALDGNLHFVFTQDFSTQFEIDRYSNLMNEVCTLVTIKYNGSLKAEHGTGRNMAPFVELEWGNEAYTLMKRIKSAFDPNNILSPGVVINNNPLVHLENLKPLPAINDKIDKCIECGFCEPNCVSANFTLSPRQRIVVYREISNLTKKSAQTHILASLNKSYAYAINETCATDGLCAIDCPVNIDTGKLVKQIRADKIGQKTEIAGFIANNFDKTTTIIRIALTTVSFFRRVFGNKIMKSASGVLTKISKHKIPAWNEYIPHGAKNAVIKAGNQKASAKKVVYFPSCINRTMGVSDDYKNEKQLTEVTINLINKAGYEVIFPENLNNLCCGMAFLSKGYTEAGIKKSKELESELIRISKNYEYPVLCDMSPCLYTMKEQFSSNTKLYEPVEFILEYLIPNLDIKKVDEKITVFAVCSAKKLGIENKLTALAKICASEVLVNESNCCGFAGDKGFLYPALNEHGLTDLKNQIPGLVKHGFSTSRTCEIGLSHHSGINYKSIIYLVDKVSSPKI